MLISFEPVQPSWLLRGMALRDAVYRRLASLDSLCLLYRARWAKQSKNSSAKMATCMLESCSRLILLYRIPCQEISVRTLRNRDRLLGTP